jgi:hypothetical protein
MNTLKPNQQRAKIVLTFIWLVLAFEIISLISDYFQFLLLQNAAEGKHVSLEMANANDNRQQVIAIVYVIVYIISGITFILWFRRAYFNLHIKKNNLSYTDGWAAGCWFVPILNFYKPYQIMKELYRETDNLLSTKYVNDAEHLKTSTLGWWWALFLISGLIGRIAFNYSLHTDTVDKLIGSTVASMLSSIVSIPLALITIKVIKDYSNIEPLLFEMGDEII